MNREMLYLCNCMSISWLCACLSRDFVHVYLVTLCMSVSWLCCTMFTLFCCT